MGKALDWLQCLGHWAIKQRVFTLPHTLPRPLESLQAPSAGRWPPHPGAASVPLGMAGLGSMTMSGFETQQRKPCSHPPSQPPDKHFESQNHQGSEMVKREKGHRKSPQQLV